MTPYQHNAYNAQSCEPTQRSEEPVLVVKGGQGRKDIYMTPSHQNTPAKKCESESVISFALILFFSGFVFGGLLMLLLIGISR